MPVKELTCARSYYSLLEKEDKLVVIDFYADWCGPCRRMAPYIEQLSEDKEYENVVFFKINIEKLDKLSDNEGVTSLPTFLFYKSGQKIAKVVGASKQEFDEVLDEYK